MIGSLILIFNTMFTFAVPAQEYSCLHASYFLVDKTDVAIKRDHLVAFNLPVNTPYFRQGTRWIKLVVGLPGDHIKISHDAVAVNGKEYPNNMNILLMKLGIDKGQVEREITLGADQYFVVGETELSYDSRFWGFISKKNVIGNAYALL